MIEVEVITELSRRASRGDVKRILEGVAPTIAQVLGERIRRRVVERGDVGGQHVSDWSDFSPMLVSARYPGAGRGALTKSGARLFKSNRAFHLALGRRLGAYSMAGLSRVIVSAELVHLKFRGRSEGQDARIIAGRSRPLRVSNALKAWTVYAKKRVHLLAPSTEEFSLLNTAMVHSAAVGVSIALPVQWQGQGPAGSSVEEICRRILQTPRGTPLSDGV